MYVFICVYYCIIYVCNFVYMYVSVGTHKCVFVCVCVCVCQKNPGVVGEDVDKARSALEKVQGFVVEMPLHFLETEDLEPNLTHIINFAPDCLFT